MRTLCHILGIITVALGGNLAAAADFSGTWSIDLRTPAERSRKAECGVAQFVLKQTKDQITGSHMFATTDCGRINEGGEDTVKGIVVGDVAILVVTSGRNEAVVIGTAKIKGDSLYWETRETIRPGQPEGDSPLILGKGALLRERKDRVLQPNISLQRDRDR
jgi:hypothetical protein